jgi:zinc transporter ZupT
MSAEPPEAPPELSPEEMAILIRTIESAMRRQRIRLAGYILALVVMLGGMAGAFWLFGRLPEDSFRAPVLLAPLVLVGLILWVFGYLAKKSRR